MSHLKIRCSRLHVFSQPRQLCVVEVKGDDEISVGFETVH